MIKTTLLSLQIYVQKYPKAVGGEKYADKIYAEIVLICMIQTLYPTNIASKP